MSQKGSEDRMGGFAIHRQPDDTTCGPTCLHAVYRHWGLDIPLPQLIREMPKVEGGGTLAVLLGIDALRRGFEATLYTYNLRLFDPIWFQDADTDIRERLETQMKAKKGEKFQVASKAYIEFLDLGGRIQYEDLSPPVLVRHLVSGHPVLCGLSATYLYRSVRERVLDCEPDDVAGEPVGH
ncbi:MAG: hypothetical protein R3F20_18850, partial [Planctomycetota bacterium]